LKYGYENAGHQIDYLAAGACADGHGHCFACPRVEKLQLLHADLARKERNNYELPQYDLQEWQVHLQ